MTRPAAQRLFDLLAQLPSEQRVSIALALADVSQELLTAPPTQADNELETIRRLEIEMRDEPPARRVAMISERTGLSRSTIYRRLKISRKGVSRETGSSLALGHEQRPSRNEVPRSTASGTSRD